MGKKLVVGENDFETICKNQGKEYLLSEWDKEKNVYNPYDISFGSGKKVWWKCPDCGISYMATAHHRLKGTDCPECKYKKIGKTRRINYAMNKHTFGDLYPELLLEWDYDKNNTDPFAIAPNHTRKVWWKCKKGHSWEALTPNRIKGRGCPYCANKKIIVGENDFASTNTEMLDSWDYSLNEILPTRITNGSGKQVFWKCEKGHSWKSTIHVRKICGCPVCSNRKIVPGENDLATTNPELIEEWDYKKNDITPQEVGRGSEMYVWWRCEYGHEWRTRITNRVHGTSCPECKKYIKTSFPEQALFYYIKQSYPDAINTYCGKGFEIDVFIPSLNCGIEYDGWRWHQDVNKDIKKNNKCRKADISLIRIREKGCPQPDNSFDLCIFMTNNHEKELENKLKELLKHLNGKEVDINFERDRQDIYTNYIVSKRENSIAEKRPDLISEWHPEKNKSIAPHMLTYGTNKKIWWICSKGHEWQAAVSSRTSGANTGCPICSNRKIVKGINDISTVAPKLLDYWDYYKNTDLPEQCGLSQMKKYWWICKSGHSWNATPYAVNKNQNPCPICSSRTLTPGVNDFATIYNASLLKEWDYNKNDINPSQIPPGKDCDVWWKCQKCGASWKARLSNRTHGNKTGCPECAWEKRKRTKRKFISDTGKSLASVFPDIAREWHPYLNKNLPFNANTVGAKSAEKVWWKCSDCGYEWEGIIRYRTKNRSKCPKCAQELWNKEHGRHVVNIDTGETFDTIAAAARKYNCTLGNIRLCCIGKTKSACGYHWAYQ